MGTQPAKSAHIRRVLFAKPAVFALAALTLLPTASPAFLAGAWAQETPPTMPAEEEPEALTRGPVHEAFATPVPAGEQEATFAPTAPPANIQENTPAQRPAGDNVVWVPGYWSWDAERKDYIWVSACWRTTVPGMEWVPGYWRQTDRGYEWIPGFWSKTSTQEIQYLPAPPPVDIQPITVAPSPDVVWVPPCHYWVHDRYILRNGYWLTVQPGWVWCPSYYARTPRGYVFVSGHWDYEFDRRGVLFAPVYIHHRHLHAHYRYTPTVVIQTRGLYVNLFACPRYSHFYFGDYYDNVYISVGIYPWFECERRRTWYDPCFQYDRWRHGRHDHNRWDNDRRRDYDARRNDANLRPARTYREMESRAARAPEPQRRDIQIARPLNNVAADKDNPVRFQPVSNEERRNFSERETKFDQFRQDRNRWESQARNDNRTDRADSGRDARKDIKTPDRVKTAGSPVAVPPRPIPRAPEPNQPPVRANEGRDANPARSNPNREPSRGNPNPPPSTQTPDRRAPSNPENKGSGAPPNRGPSDSGRNTENRGNASRGSDGRGSESRGADKPSTPPPAPSPAPAPAKQPEPRAPGGSGQSNAQAPDANRGSNSRGSDNRGSESRGADKPSTPPPAPAPQPPPARQPEPRAPGGSGQSNAQAPAPAPTPPPDRSQDRGGSSDSSRGNSNRQSREGSGSTRENQGRSDRSERSDRR